ncbi:alpha-glucoside ABC transporter permease, partial [Rhizobium leguminosarum]
MLSQIVSALGFVVGAVIAFSAYFYFSNKILDLALPVEIARCGADVTILHRQS